ncbi:glycoside hydrolase [Mycena olivaceomarginata]|nr:glycoside hydrolase [Mycena olivaceomarginata]
MRAPALILSLALLVPPIASQQIWDIWQTTWDRSQLSRRWRPPLPSTSARPAPLGPPTLMSTTRKTFQSVWGFGGTLCMIYAARPVRKTPGNYFALLNYMFSPTDGANAAGINYIRVPLGASDFSANLYSFDDASGDTSFNSFNIGKAPSYLYSVLKDIQSVNPVLKVHILPWSPPGWMKTTGTMNGGSLSSQYVSIYANYLLKCLQGFKSEGITSLYAISIQNEPQNSQTSYPTTSMTVAVHAQVGIALRALMNNNGFSTVKLIGPPICSAGLSWLSTYFGLGYEHNWDNAGTYPIQLMQAAPNAFDGVAFHCYSGDVSQQDTFHAAFPTKEINFTECSGTIGRNFMLKFFQPKFYQKMFFFGIQWSDIKWYMDNLFTGAITHNAHSALMWNIALDSGAPKLPGTTSCGGAGYRSIAQVNNDGTYSLNQEFYAMAQPSKAIIPKDAGGPFGKRVGVGAYVTGRVNPADWLRYSLVVLNWDDSVGGWNPTPVATTIEFRGMQAKYTFPVGVTTLWWFAPDTSLKNATMEGPTEIYAETDGKQQPLGVKFAY